MRIMNLKWFMAEEFANMAKKLATMAEELDTVACKKWRGWQSFRQG